MSVVGVPFIKGCFSYSIIGEQEHFCALKTPVYNALLEGVHKISKLPIVGGAMFFITAPETVVEDGVPIR